MKKYFFLSAAIIVAQVAGSQDIHAIIHEKEAGRIETFLSSDALQGRKINTDGIEKAAEFIGNEFKKTGLGTFKNTTDYRQSFIVLKAMSISTNAVADGESMPDKNVIVITPQPDLEIKEKTGYEKITIGAKDNLFNKCYPLVQSGKNYIAFIDTSFSANFSRLSFFKRQMMPSAGNVVFMLTSKQPEKFAITAKHSFDSLKLSNVVGVLPGKSKPGEYIIFSAHYDHLGTGKIVNGDSIYNGANDDASGTTAVIMLAQYFKALNNNQRTLIFTAFTAEESGGYGSRFFSEQLKPADVKAMFNIEMIGTASKWGENSAYITGFEKTDMGTILQKNLEGTTFSFYPDPYLKENLFYRSDNATLARLGVPAHTISTSKMDDEPNYHKPSDETGTLDMANMAAVIKAIAISARSIIMGKDTPSRVDTSQLK